MSLYVQLLQEKAERRKQNLLLSTSENKTVQRPMPTPPTIQEPNFEGSRLPFKASPLGQLTEVTEPSELDTIGD